MDELELLQRDISETKYLATLNTYRYRPIMRLFYRKYEQAQNWLYKEEIYEALSGGIEDYSLEDLEQDLNFLVLNKNLVTVQDVKNIQTLDDFRNKKFRYQMTDYAKEIEEMTIELEELDVKAASLSPRRFEVLKKLISKIKEIDGMTPQEFDDLWKQIKNEFKDLNRNYQDFLKKFQESKTEELLESEIFLEYKNKMISYLQDFIKGYLINGAQIRKIMEEFDDDVEEKIVSKLEQNRREIPNPVLDFNYEKFNIINRGNYNSIKKWFVRIDGESCEGDRLMNVATSIITQISKCASSLIELHGNMIARKEEYKYLCKMFDRKTTIEESNALSSVIFGVASVNHFKGVSTMKTDSIVPSYEVSPINITIEPNDRRIKKEKIRPTIESKMQEKEEILNRQMEIDRKQRENLSKLLNKDKITLSGKIDLSKEEREYILSLISRGTKKINREHVMGRYYRIKEGMDECIINSPDGTMKMAGIEIEFVERGAYHE